MPIKEQLPPNLLYPADIFNLDVKVIQCFVLVMEYIRRRAPSVYFITNNKTLYNLFVPDPAASCVADKQISHREIYTLCSISAFHLRDCRFFLRNGCVHMGQVDFISSIFVRFFSQDYVWSFSCN